MITENKPRYPEDDFMSEDEQAKEAVCILRERSLNNVADWLENTYEKHKVKAHRAFRVKGKFTDLPMPIGEVRTVDVSKGNLGFGTSTRTAPWSKYQKLLFSLVSEHERADFRAEIINTFAEEEPDLFREVIKQAYKFVKDREPN